MSETVKLIIEMPKEIYESRYGDECDEKDCLIIDTFTQAIANGIPLDDVKAEIKNKYYAEEEPTIYQMGTNLGLRLAVDILDNIGKAESEDKPNE